MNWLTCHTVYLWVFQRCCVNLWYLLLVHVSSTIKSVYLPFNHCLECALVNQVEIFCSPQISLHLNVWHHASSLWWTAMVSQVTATRLLPSKAGSPFPLNSDSLRIPFPIVGLLFPRMSRLQSLTNQISRRPVTDYLMLSLEYCICLMSL